MKRGRSTSTPTAAQQRRFAAIHEIGCICCRELGLGFVPAEVHHLTIGGRHGQKRRGHDATVGLCAYHHRGAGYGTAAMGASYARHPHTFRAQWPDARLLEIQEMLIERLNENTIGGFA